MMGKAKYKVPAFVDDIPGRISDSEVLYYVQTKKINWSYVDMIKRLTLFTDETISNWLNISVKTFRSYKQTQMKFKDNLKEQIVLILSVLKHGKQVFGTQEAFNNWLNAENFYFDGKAPVSFMNTITGIRLIDDRLTGMEYGDNA